MAKAREEAKSKHGPGDRERALQAEVKRLQASNRKLRKQSGDSEWLISELESRIGGMKKMPTIKRASRIEPQDEQFRRPLHAVLFFGDEHMEEVVDPAETEGLLDYNFDRYLRSMWYLAKVTVRLVGIMRAKHNVPTLHVANMGDAVTGEIHPDVYHTNAFYLPDALTAGPWYRSQFVRELSAHFDRVNFTSIPGNHGRMDQKPSSKRYVGRNWDTCMAQNTAVITSNLKNVHWQIPRSPKCVINVNGWYFLLQHGDQVAQHGGTMPYYGIARQRSSELAKRVGGRVRDIEDKLEAGLLFDYDVRGHHHMYGTVDERTILVPSVMGNNEFGLNRTFVNKLPGARLCFVDEEHGLAGDWRIGFAELPEKHEFQPLPQWD